MRERRRAQNLLVVCGVAILLWSGVEDTGAEAVTMLGLLVALAATGMILPRALHSLPYSIIAGAIFGALTSLSTTALMVFKDLRHAHPFPDYPPGMLLATLERLPAWALAGGLLALGIALLLRETDRLKN